MADSQGFTLMIILTQVSVSESSGYESSSSVSSKYFSTDLDLLQEESELAEESTHKN